MRAALRAAIGTRFKGNKEYWFPIQVAVRSTPLTLELALEQKPGEWPWLVDKACASDEELRREVEALLAAHEQAGSFISFSSLGSCCSEDSNDQPTTLEKWE